MTLISEGYHACGCSNNSVRQSNQSQNQEDNLGQNEDDEHEDEFERDPDQDMKRSQSERVLSDQRITMQHYKKKLAKKGKYDVTVPAPFAFDIRDKNRPMTIAERKAEADRLEREVQEREIVNFQF